MTLWGHEQCCTGQHWDSNEKKSDSSSSWWLKHPRWWGLASPCRWVFAFVFSVLIVAGGKSAAEPGPQQIGKAFGKADMTWRFFEVHKDASTWCMNHIFMYFIRWVNVSFVTTTAEAMPKQHLQWSAFQQRRPRDAAISVDGLFGWGWDCAEMVPSISLWTVGWKKYIFIPIHTKYFDRSFVFFGFLKAILNHCSRPPNVP